VEHGVARDGVALWGTRDEHGFWPRDGAISDFRNSGIGNPSVFLLQDLQGAVFFRPFLGALIGIICGSVAAAVALIAATIRRRIALDVDCAARPGWPRCLGSPTDFRAQNGRPDQAREYCADAAPTRFPTVDCGRASASG
jgi:hypothetical protein